MFIRMSNYSSSFFPLILHYTITFSRGRLTDESAKLLNFNIRTERMMCCWISGEKFASMPMVVNTPAAVPAKVKSNGLVNSCCSGMATAVVTSQRAQRHQPTADEFLVTGDDSFILSFATHRS